MLGFVRADPVARALVAAKPETEPAPWRVSLVAATGGLWAIGFDPDSDEVIVVSASGQGVYDPHTGQRVFRARDADGYDAQSLSARRLDRETPVTIAVAGIDGGGLHTGTSDGWNTRVLYPSLREACCILEPPGASIYFRDEAWRRFRKDARFFLLQRCREEVRAFGFSPSGHVLALATSSSLWLWTRN